MSIENTDREVFFENCLQTATEAAKEAGRFLFDNLKTPFSISKKGRINLVTEMDVKAEEMIISRIREQHPEHQILAEERGLEEGTSPARWIVDPLDGTTNYSHGYRFFCVSIALEWEGVIELGAVFDPVTSELFSARRGKGAWLNGRPISVSDGSSLLDSLLCTGFSYHRSEIQKNLQLFGRLIMEARAVRRDGAAALDLCFVACGRFDGFWELSLNPWDVAAGKLIVEEAGGLVTGFDGSPCTVYDRQIVASNGKIHAQIINLF